MSDEHPFNQTVSTTNQWLAEVAEAAGVSSDFRAYQALRVTLHALRDRLPIDVSVAATASPSASLTD